MLPPAAPPVPAQAGACLPHGGEEVRCAIRLHKGPSTLTCFVKFDLPGPVAGPIRLQALDLGASRIPVN